MNQLRQHIKNVLIEENQNKKVNLVKQMIYDLFDVEILPLRSRD